MAADLLSKIRLEIDERLRDLRPLLAEYERLLGAVDALELAAAEVSLPTRPVAKAKTEIRAKADTKADTTAKTKAETETRAKAETRARARAEAETSATAKTRPERAGSGISRETILAALDHGSHTVAELAVVTAMSAPSINGNLRKLLAEGAIVKTEREGKAAWALPDAL
jgi:membrane protein involved in colicin uptake